MNSDELVDAIEELSEVESIDLVEEKTRRFFIFKLGNTSYALRPENVKEILSDLTVYPVPACPPYIAGLVNCHGIPHSVFELRVLLENERLETIQFLVINAANDHVVFACSEIEEIAEIAPANITDFSTLDSDTRFYEAIITLADRKIPVLSTAQILLALEADLA